VRIALRISKQRTYKLFVLILMRACCKVALFWGRFITVPVGSRSCGGDTLKEGDF
jgi:hypothetical protein